MDFRAQLEDELNRRRSERLDKAAEHIDSAIKRAVADAVAKAADAIEGRRTPEVPAQSEPTSDPAPQAQSGSDQAQTGQAPRTHRPVQRSGMTAQAETLAKQAARDVARHQVGGQQYLEVLQARAAKAAQLTGVDEQTMASTIAAYVEQLQQQQPGQQSSDDDDNNGASRGRVRDGLIRIVKPDQEGGR